MSTQAFFSLQSAPETVQAALNGLQSHGLVKQPYGLDHQGRSQRDGLMCERIFGPLHALRCRCGFLQGDAHRGEECSKCAVLCDLPSLHATRWGHIDLPCGLIHPGAVSAVAEVLERSIESVKADLKNNEIAALASALDAKAAQRLLVFKIPVTPPTERQSTRMDHPSGRVALRPHPAFKAYQRVINRANRLHRLIELNAPEIILSNEHAALQTCFDALLVADTVPIRTVVVPRTVTVMPYESDDLDGVDSKDPSAIIGALWLTEAQILIQRGTTTVILALDGAVIEHWKSDARIAAWASADGQQIACVERWPSVEFDEDTPALAKVYNAGVWQRSTGWLPIWPNKLPCSLVQWGAPEYAWMDNAHDGPGEEVSMHSDRPALNAWSRDGSMLWITDCGAGGALVAADTGAALVTVAEEEAPRILREDGTWIEPLDEVFEDFWERTGPQYGAIAQTVDGTWRVVDSHGAVGDENGPFFLLGFEAQALAWSPDGTRLLVVTCDAFQVLAVHGQANATWTHKQPLPVPDDNPCTDTQSGSTLGIH